MWALKFSDADAEEEFIVLPLVDDCEGASLQGGKEFSKTYPVLGTEPFKKLRLSRALSAAANV